MKLAFWFQRRRFLNGFYHIWAWQPFWSCDPDVAKKTSIPLSIEDPYEIWLQLAQLFLKRRRLKSFPDMSLYKTSDLCGGAIFDPRAKIWTILVEFHKIKLHTKYQRPLPSSFRQADKKNFKVLPIGIYVEKIDLTLKRSTKGYNFFQTLLGPCLQCCIPIPRAIGPLVPEKKSFKGFLQYIGIAAILVMWPRCGK